MKKIVAVLTIVLTLFQCLPAAALASDDDATDRVSVLEFCELYTKRLMEFNEKYGQNMGGLDTTINSLFGASDWGDTYGVSCSGGFLTINKTDLTIEKLTTTIIDVDAEGQEGHNVVLKALIAISALEMNDLAAEGIEMMHNIDSSLPENVYMKYLEEYTNIIQPALSSNADKLDAGEDVLIYQGNYDYYAFYENYSDVGKSIYLIAEAREPKTDEPEEIISPSFDIDVYEEDFPTEERIQFCLYEAVQDLSRSLGWYVTQNHNPEAFFDANEQELSSVSYYLDYYADCTASEAREAVEEYTDTIIEAIQYAFPNIKTDLIIVFWRIPAKDEDSLYAAQFFCENEGGTIVRGDGSGLIYQ